MSAAAPARDRLPATRTHPRGCAITHRPALEAAAKRLRLADASGQCWLQALACLHLWRVHYASPRDGILVHGTGEAARPASVTDLAAAVDASRTTTHRLLDLCRRAGVLTRDHAGRWRLVDPRGWEGNPGAGQQLHTWRLAEREASAALRDTDPTGRMWRSAYGAWVVLRHRARWDTGELALTASQAAAIFGVARQTWVRWRALAEQAGVLVTTDTGVAIRPWARLEGLATDGSQLPGQCSEFSPRRVHSFQPPSLVRAREAPGVTQDRGNQQALPQRTQHPSSRPAGVSDPAPAEEGSEPPAPTPKPGDTSTAAESNSEDTVGEAVTAVVRHVRQDLGTTPPSMTGPAASMLAKALTRVFAAEPEWTIRDVVTAVDAQGPALRTLPAGSNVRAVVLARIRHVGEQTPPQRRRRKARAAAEAQAAHRKAAQQAEHADRQATAATQAELDALPAETREEIYQQAREQLAAEQPDPDFAASRALLAHHARQLYRHRYGDRHTARAERAGTAGRGDSNGSDPPAASPERDTAESGLRGGPARPRAGTDRARPERQQTRQEPTTGDGAQESRWCQSAQSVPSNEPAAAGKAKPHHTDSLEAAVRWGRREANSAMPVEHLVDAFRSRGRDAVQAALGACAEHTSSPQRARQARRLARSWARTESQEPAA